MIKPSPDEVKTLGPLGRLTLWIRQHERMARLVSLSSGLIIFFLLMPAYIRIVFWNGLRAHKILASMLLIFSLLSVSLVWSTGQQIDAWFFLLLNVRGTRPPWLDRIMLGFTQIGSATAAMGIALILFLTNNRPLAYQLVLGALTLWLVVELVKFMVHRGRPFIVLVQARIVGTRAIGRSFPSGHTSQAFFIATLMAQHFHSSAWIVILLYAAAFLVGITRMYVGAHYPRDVLAGAILGSLWGFVGVILDGYVLNGFG